MLGVEMSHLEIPGLLESPEQDKDILDRIVRHFNAGAPGKRDSRPDKVFQSILLHCINKVLPLRGFLLD
jgi:hypothetical protein